VDAVTAGAVTAPVLAGHERAVAALAAAVLAGVAVHLLRASRRPAAPEAAGPGRAPLSPVRTAARFAALTAVNPLTLVTFAAVAAALPPGTSAPWFVPGVAAGSGAWQVVLACGGALLRRHGGDRVRRRSGPVGAAVVLAAAVLVLARAR